MLQGRLGGTGSAEQRGRVGLLEISRLWVSFFTIPTHSLISSSFPVPWLTARFAL